MAQIEPKDLDHSQEMIEYFRDVIRILKDYGKSPEDAEALVNRYFTLDVAPLERALAMHRGAKRIARDLISEVPNDIPQHVVDSYRRR